MNDILDNFLESAIYAFDLADNGASKTEHDIANVLLRKNETVLIHTLGLNLEETDDSDKFDRILELTEEYRNDESLYETLVNYIESLR